MDLYKGKLIDAYFLLSYKADFMLFFSSAHILPGSLWLHLCFKPFVQIYTVCSAMVFFIIFKPKYMYTQ